MNGIERRRLPVDLEELASAFENGFPDLSYYLDVETGAVAMVSDETRRELEPIYAELGNGEDLDDAAVAEAIQRRNVPDWQREVLEEADRVERGFGTRYVTVPRDDTHDAFGRFKRVLSAHDEDLERWFAFRDACMRDRIIVWLEEQGIEPRRER